MPGWAVIFGCVLLLWGTRALGAGVTGLECEQTVAPMGVDAAHPSLSWQVDAAGERGVRQSAYQILAASTAELLAKDQGDLWDTGKVVSADSLGVKYRGKALASAERVFWKVRVWDQNDKAGAYGTAATFTMGLLADADWKGKWIGAGGAAHVANSTVILRHEFAARAVLARATLFVCGLGQYEFSLNGQKVGDDILSPGWTDYKKTCLYDTFDVTAMVREGKNAAGIILGGGMYNVDKGRYTKFTGSFGPLMAIAQIRMDYQDGTSEVVATDEKWETGVSPITFSNEYGGEDFDARLVQKGWDQPGFDDKAWRAAAVMPGPGGALKGLSYAAPPIRTFEVFKPVKVTAIRLGVSVYDLGQNAAMMPRMVVSGPAGSTVRMTPAELVKADGTVDRGSVGGGQAYWQYTLAGTGQEAWFPKFFYQGARYVQVEVTSPNVGGVAGALPVVAQLEGVVVHSSAAAVGTFECSNPLMNRIQTLIRWAQVSNMVSLMTDCPTREKLGWLEESHLNGPSLRYDFDLGHFFHKTVNDMADAQTAAGLVPDIAPEFTVFSGGFRDSPEWGSALPLVAWQQYEFTGDGTLLERYYPNMKRYVDYLTSKSAGHIVSHGLGDWYDIGPKAPGNAQLTPKELTATAFYFADAEVVVKAAKLLGNAGDAETYGQLAADTREAFNKKFFNAATGSYSTGSQTANSIPLVMGLAEPGNRAKVLAAVVADVQAKGLTAGDVGYRYLLRALAEGGRSDVVYAMNNQSEKPGYGYQLAHGATSLTEAWDARRSSSQDHFMLGQIMEWFYHDVAGIQELEPGFKKMAIRPAMVGDLTSAKGTYECSYGKIESAWKRDEKEVEMDVVIPANTTAEVWVPAADEAKVMEGDGAAEKAAGVKFLRMEDGAAVFEVGAGAYAFKAAK